MSRKKQFWRTHALKCHLCSLKNLLSLKHDILTTSNQPKGFFRKKIFSCFNSMLQNYLHRRSCVALGGTGCEGNNGKCCRKGNPYTGTMRRCVNTGGFSRKWVKDSNILLTMIYPLVSWSMMKLLISSTNDGWRFVSETWMYRLCSCEISWISGRGKFSPFTQPTLK